MRGEEKGREWRTGERRGERRAGRRGREAPEGDLMVALLSCAEIKTHNKRVCSPSGSVHVVRMEAKAAQSVSDQEP